MSGRWSGLPDGEVEELARLMLSAVRDEWPSAGGILDSATVRERLDAEGIEVRDWEMADAWEMLRGRYVTPLPKDGAPDVEREAADFRAHGGLMIADVDTGFPGGT